MTAFHGVAFDPLALADAAQPLRDAVTRLSARAASAGTEALDAREALLTALSGAPEHAVKPLARTARTCLDTTDLRRLADGRLAEVFGDGYARPGANHRLRLAPGTPLHLLGARLMPHAGPHRLGRVRASVTPDADPVVAAAQVAQLFLLFTGMYLCLHDATFDRAPDAVSEPAEAATGGELDVVVTELDLLPVPWVRVAARCDGIEVTGVTARLRENSATPYAGRALRNELHLTHAARGDMGIAFGPDYADLTTRRTARPPSRGLQLIDRITRVEGSTHETEYDSPADSWYYHRTADTDMPNVVLMETSLQSALVPAYFLNSGLPVPAEDLILRNLQGEATVLRAVALRDTTIHQHTELLSTMPMPGTILQEVGYRLSVRGTPFYRGKSMFGHFSAQALANQTGLDGARAARTWLAENPDAPSTVVPVAGRPEFPAGELALLDTVRVVDGGGRHGRGYLYARYPIDPGCWYLRRHFHLDPVMPGSFGVEMAIQALQVWIVHNELGGALRDPGFVLPVGLPLTWTYRGQFGPGDQELVLEVHLRDVSSRAGRVRVIADADVWKPGMRIYHLSGVAAESAERGAPPWTS